MFGDIRQDIEDSALYFLLDWLLRVVERDLWEAKGVIVNNCFVIPLSIYLVILAIFPRYT